MSDSTLNAGYSVTRKTLTIDPNTGDLTIETSMSPTSDGSNSRRSSASSFTRMSSATAQDLESVFNRGMVPRVYRRSSSSSTRRVSSSSESSSSNGSSSFRKFTIKGGSPDTQFQLLKKLLPQLQQLHDRTQSHFEL